MDKQNAIKLLDETFSNDFDTHRFAKFIKELFNNFNINQKSWTVWNEYQDYIESYNSIGSYTDKSKKVIDVLIVKLKRTSSRDRARTMQRNFIAKYLGNADKDAALVAFYGDDEDWRFSFVKMEYNLLKDEEGKAKVAKELTPAKRYSFLVGINEPNHTCKRQFLELVMEDEINPSVGEIEEAFSIDKVTKEFFTEYKELYLKLKDALERHINKDSFIRKEFEENAISTVDFAKKLLGQIVFIYFLQKKGWLGVQKDKSGKFMGWGSGPKNFLRKLFEKKNYKNFFNDVLEPLFYEALATERDDDYYSRFECKIPFLNGGLFEPINEYNWRETDLLLDNPIFENILNTFDKYNFTVKEDEPLEKEVAIDPEMLGKVFENLIEENIRKGQGAYYTPREIVHYMCQQSLINYLETNSGIDRKDIEKFIQLGDFAIDILVKEKENVKRYGRSYVSDKEHKLPKSIRENYRKIDDLLKNIKIVDPAVGSGAFPVGMMNEIVKARSILSIFFNDEEQKERTNYSLKREVIENCLYGVDIDSSAVDIAKLRFWLSLIVDELDMKNIKPLPNLDHKIMCGNSLLEEFEGVKLFDDKLLGEVKKDYSFEVKQINAEISKLNQELHQIHTGKIKNHNGRSKDIVNEIKKLQKKKEQILSTPKEQVQQATIGDSLQKRIKESQKKLKELRELQQKFFNEQNRKLKKQYRDNIERIEWELVEETLKEQGNEEAMKKLQQYKKNKSKPFFLWKLYFAEVFQRENPGFDVVIANPPYVRVQNLSHEEIDIYKKIYYSAYKRIDVSILFIELSFKLVNHKGFATFITSSQFTKTEYGRRIREIMKNPLNSMVYFGDNQIFESATNYTSVFSFVKDNDMDYFLFSNAENFNLNENLSIYILKNNYKIMKDSLTDNSWELENMDNIRVVNKLKNTSKNILNDIANIEYGLVTGSDKILVFKKGKYKDLENQPFVFALLRPSETDKYHLSKTNFFVIYPYTKVNNKTILVKENELKKQSPKVYEYLRKNKSLLEKRKDSRTDLSEEGSYWYGLMRHSSFEKVIREKILTQALCKKNEFCLDKEGLFFTGGSIYSIYSIDDYINNLILLGLLNSKLAEFYYQIVCPIRQNGYRFYAGTFLKTLPIHEKLKKKEIQQPIIHLVNQILLFTKDTDYLDNSTKQSKVKKLEKEIDQLVYRLYELTPEEIKIVEEFGDDK
ncbi:MAG: TaqI-like C-terminal specificity domain-containing protein [Nanoarchaeota archaeon]